FGYDELLRMASIRTAAPGGEPLQNLEYSYDAGGNIRAITDRAFGASQTFQYDEVGRLTRAVGMYGEQKYEYDAVGNLLRKGNLAFAVDPQHLQRVVGAVQIVPAPGVAGGIVNNPYAA